MCRKISTQGSHGDDEYVRAQKRGAMEVYYDRCELREKIPLWGRSYFTQR